MLNSLTKYQTEQVKLLKDIEEFCIKMKALLGEEFDEFQFKEKVVNTKIETHLTLKESFEKHQLAEINKLKRSL